MRHLMSPLDFSVEELETLLNLAGDIEKHPEKYAHACEGKKLATLFYEPSTRTRLSHEAAMIWAEASWDFLPQIPALPQKERVFQIRSAPFLVMQISLLCAIQRKERRWLPVSTLPFLSSTQETEDISIQPRH